MLRRRFFVSIFRQWRGPALEPGIVALIQKFGERINFHSHLQFYATEGGVDEAAIFYKALCLDDSRLAEVLSRAVLAFLLGGHDTQSL